MPLDSGSLVHLHLVQPLGRASGPTAEGHATLGAYLQAEREHKGVALGAVADETRIKINHLTSIEADDWNALPSRPFAIGYVRAFAKAVGLEPGPLVERFRREVPETSVALEPPVGMAAEAGDRRPLAYVAVAALFAAVVVWNIAQRLVRADEGPARPDLAPAVAAATPVEAAGPIKIAAATPAPAEQSTPAPYVTPGLEEATGGAAPPDAAKAAQARRTADGLIASATVARAFETRAAIYGEADARSPALLMARDPVSLVVRGADGRIWFARELEPGEAYRVSLGRGLSAELSDPTAVDLYVGGQLKGSLTALATPLDKVAGAFGASAPAPRGLTAASGGPPGAEP